MIKTRTRKATSSDLRTRERADTAELAGLDRGRQLCECDHGDDETYQACGRKAKWRVSVDCECGEGHPRRVEILCSRCLATLRHSQSRESLTVRPL